MKKYITGILLVLLFISTAYAGTIMLNGATATGASSHQSVDRETNHTFSCSFLTSTSITAFTAVLQGTIDNKATWHDLGTNVFDATELSNRYSMMHVADRPVDKVRINITTLTGTDLDADCYYIPGR
ncbi:hypothetical protein KAR91_69290 [Candidatus Pacearchaeota archaeon]|nr:hypothetical protein [Candidatus Pacearchaeota archaeon]